MVVFSSFDWICLTLSYIAMLMVSLLKHIYLSCYESLAYIQDFDRIILVELAKDHVQPGNDRGNFMNLYPKERERERIFFELLYDRRCSLYEIIQSLPEHYLFRSLKLCLHLFFFLFFSLV